MARADIVGILFIIWGALTMLIGLSTLALGLGAIALITSSHGGARSVGAGITAIAFMTLAVIAIFWGLAHVVTGFPLRRKQPWSRIVALALAAVDILLLPYGTALGAYALWVLLNEKEKALFAPGVSAGAIPQ